MGRSNTASSNKPAPLISIDRLVAGALACALTLQPALAQNRGTDAELEALIPDAAIDNPDAFASVQAPTGASAEPEVDPASPLADIAGFTLAWPAEGMDLPALVSLDPDPDLATAFADAATLPELHGPQGDVARISARLSLAFPLDPVQFPEREEFEDRFRGLSTIETLGGGDDEVGQIGVRARADRDLLGKLLRVYGYYDADVIQTINGIEPGADAATKSAGVRFDVVPGPRYKFGKVELPTLETTGADFALLRGHFGILPGDPVNSDKIVTAQGELDLALAENGYPFAKLGEPDLLIDHRREEGDLTQPVTAGGKYTFGRVVSNLPQFLSSQHLEEIARFNSGDLYQRSLRDDLRRAVLATGLAASVSVTPREVRAPTPDQPGEVALDVAMTKAPVRTISGQLGYDTGDGFRAEVQWENRNLFPPEGMLRVRGIAGTKEQLAGVTFRRNNFKGRDQVLTADVYASNTNRDAFAARTVAASASFEKLTTLLFQKPWVWSAGLEVTLSDEREGSGNTNAPRSTYLVGAIPLRAAYDGTDDLLDPTKGIRASLRVSPELSRHFGTSSFYAKVQADASAYLPVGNFVLAARTRLGSIQGGVALQDVAPSRRFYAGGGGSVRGYGFQLIGPRNAAGDPSGGRSLYEVSFEARIKTGLFDGNLSVVPFIDAGGVDEGSIPSFSDIRFGAGVGVRYKTGFGPIRVDLATPLNPRPGDSRIAVYVALGQAF
ncbi:MAG: BamA/TamA family outer membrane protein [Novosphingobium sp.]